MYAFGHTLFMCVCLYMSMCVYACVYDYTQVYTTCDNDGFIQPGSK